MKLKVTYIQDGEKIVFPETDPYDIGEDENYTIRDFYLAGQNRNPVLSAEQAKYLVLTIAGTANEFLNYLELENIVSIEF